jgi:hypothetical protein
MLEVTIWSLLVGNLGWQSVVISGWLRWRQIATRRQHQEEEESLAVFNSREHFASAEPPQRNGKVDSANHSLQASVDPQHIGWEFKIVRAHRDVFRNPVVFQKLCEEEALAGWIMLEKIDDRRVRFKRLIALREVLDASKLSYDPYRCHYGSSFTPLNWIGAIAFFSALVIPSYLGYSLVSTMLSNPQAKSPTLPGEYENIPPQNFPSPD